MGSVSWPTVIATLIGVVIAQAGALVILWRTNRHQDRRDREERAFRARLDAANDRRHIRDAQAARLRQAFQPFTRGSLALQIAANQQGVLFNDETVEQRNERLAKMLNESLAGLGPAGVGLELESVGREVLDTYARVVHPAYTSYTGMLSLNRQHPGSFTIDVLDAELKRLSEGVDALIQAARMRLELLETVIGAEPEPVAAPKARR